MYIFVYVCKFCLLIQKAKFIFKSTISATSPKCTRPNCILPDDPIRKASLVARVWFCKTSLQFIQKGLIPLTTVLVLTLLGYCQSFNSPHERWWTNISHYHESSFSLSLKCNNFFYLIIWKRVQQSQRLGFEKKAYSSSLWDRFFILWRKDNLRRRWRLALPAAFLLIVCHSPRIGLNIYEMSLVFVFTS